MNDPWPARAEPARDKRPGQGARFSSPTMIPHPAIQEAVESLCTLFKEGGYALTPIIDLGTLVMSADGAIDENELDILRYLYYSLLGSQIGPDVVQHLVRTSQQIVNEAGLKARAKVIAEILVDCDAVAEGLTVALGIAFASEGLADAERAVIASIAEAADVSPTQLDDLIEHVRATVEGGYEEGEYEGEGEYEEGEYEENGEGEGKAKEGGA
jgi:uncharacterized tellurite resistance protein B-like protein